MKNTLMVSIVGLAYLRDEELVDTLILMSTNQNKVSYLIFDNDPTETKHTPPLKFDFFKYPVMFAFHQGGAPAGYDVFERTRIRLLPKADVVLVSLGEKISDWEYLHQEKDGRLKSLLWILEAVKEANKPTVYALNNYLNQKDLFALKNLLKIPISSELITYNRAQPDTLQRLLQKIFETPLNNP